MIAILVFAAYMNPDMKIITIKHNFIRATTARVYYELSKAYSSKIVELHLMSAIFLSEHCEMFLEDLTEGAMNTLNLSNIPLQSRACRLIGRFLVNQKRGRETFRNLNLQNCKIAN